MNRLLSLLLCLTASMSLAAEEAKPRTDLYGDPLPPGAVMRLGTIRLRHAHADVVFSKDGKQVISCGDDGEVRVWNAVSGRLVQRKQLDGTPLKDERFQKALFAPNGALVAIRSGWSIHLYDRRTGKERGRVPVEDLSELRTFSANGKVLALQTNSGGSYRLQLCTTDDCKCRRSFGPIEQSPVALSADGKRLAALGADERLRIWDTVGGVEISKSKERIAGGQLSLAFSPDSKLLAVASMFNGKVRLLDAATLKPETELKMPADLKAESIEALTFSPDGRLLVGSYIDGESRNAGAVLWNLKDIEKGRRLPQGGCIDRFVFSADGRTLAGRDALDSEIRLWELPSGRPLLRRPAHNAPVKVLAVSPDGKTIASADAEPTLRDRDVATISNDVKPALRLWDMATGKPLHVLEGEHAIHTCLFSPDGKQVISAARFGTVETWDVETGKKRRRLNIERSEEEGFSLHAIGISADGKRLAAVGGEIGSTQLSIYDLITGKPRERRPYRGLQIEHRFQRKYRVIVIHVHATFAPDGESVSVFRDGRIGLEEVATGCLRVTLPKEVSAPLVFSADGRLVAAIVQTENQTDEASCLSILETATGAEIVRLESQVFEHAAFTPDSRGVVVVGKKHLRVWDTVTGECLHEMAWPESIHDAYGEVEICSLAVLPGGRAATGMRDGDILIWDLYPSTWLARKAKRDLGPKELEALWSALAGEARPAHRALSRLSATPAQTAAMLNQHLRPVTVDAKRIDKLLADLDGDSFEVREAASRELTQILYRAEPMLRRAWEDKPSLEMRRRIESILAEPRQQPVEALRTLRAIAVLESIGTAEARRILKKLVGGTDAPETREAKAALQRLKRRDVSASGRTSP